MAKLTIYVPDALAKRIRGPEGDRLNVSETCRRALVAKLDENARHPEVIDA